MLREQYLDERTLFSHVVLPPMVPSSGIHREKYVIRHDCKAWNRPLYCYAKTLKEYLHA